MTVSPFDHLFLSGLLGDEEVDSCFSAQADIAAMLSFETALAAAEAEEGLIDSDAAVAIATALDTFEPDMDELRAGTARDGVVVPELVRQLRLLLRRWRRRRRRPPGLLCHGAGVPAEYRTCLLG